MEISTLFVWKEWMRLIEFRVTEALKLNERDVTTAICKGLGKNMDPEYVLRFAQKDGFYHCDRPSVKLPNFDKAILNILERTKCFFTSLVVQEKEIPESIHFWHSRLG
jgi:hypothetical protein